MFVHRGSDHVESLQRRQPQASRQIDPSRPQGMAEVVRILLNAGASPNTNARWR
jgi:hypothetical protein